MGEKEKGKDRGCGLAVGDDGLLVCARGCRFLKI